MAPGSFLIRPTRFESPQIGEKIGRKTRSFAPYMFWTKLPLAPQQMNCFGLSFLSFLVFCLFQCCLTLFFFPSFLVFFQCCLSLTHFSFVLGAHLFLFSPVLFCLFVLFCFVFFLFVLFCFVFFFFFQSLFL